MGATRRAAALIAVLFACPVGVGVAQAAVAHPDAKGLTNTSATIRDPGDRDWFVIPGVPPSRGSLFAGIHAAGVPVGCNSGAPLVVGFYNPEGSFIRRIDPGPEGGYSLQAPIYPGRYLLSITVTDPGCSPLGYTVTIGGSSPGYVSAYDSHADLCAGLRANVRGARRRLKRMRAKARTVSKSARPRYRKLVHRRERQLATARAAYAKHKCTPRA